MSESPEESIEREREKKYLKYNGQKLPNLVKDKNLGIQDAQKERYKENHTRTHHRQTAKKQQ